MGVNVVQFSSSVVEETGHTRDTIQLHMSAYPVSFVTIILRIVCQATMQYILAK